MDPLNDILTSHCTRQPVVMGILNVTPDSFSDGGRYLDPTAAKVHARQMLLEGADLIDIGAESTRPGADRVSPREQIARLREVVPALVEAGATVSIDTTRAKVAEVALDAGAGIVNDVSAGRDDSEMLPMVAARGVPLVLMHMLGEPNTMQENPQYDNVVEEVKGFLELRLEAAIEAGVPRERCILDPGIGFGKLLEHNLALLSAGVSAIRELGCPVLVGASRKRFIGEITGEQDPIQRVWGSVAAHVEAFHRGATIFRAHDVAATVQALKVARAIGMQDG